MNFYELLKITDKSIEKIEQDLGRPLNNPEKLALIKGAITKWNEANPDNWIVIPAEFTSAN